MREANATAYREPRDAIARDWEHFMASVLPEAQWIPLVNSGERIIDCVRAWNLNAFIFSGGNDLGAAPARDLTESFLLEYAAGGHYPILGICRGMQFLCSQLGLPIQPCPQDGHAGTNHEIRINNPPFGISDRRITVNSYHDQCVGDSNQEIKQGTIVWATSTDGLIEGIHCPQRQWLGIMWHPERNHPCASFDRLLIRRFLGLDTGDSP